MSSQDTQLQKIDNFLRKWNSAHLLNLTWCFIFAMLVYIIWLCPKLEWTGMFHITWFCDHCKHTVIYTRFWGFECDPKFLFHSESYNSECWCCDVSSWACNHSRETVHNSEEKFFNCIRWRRWRMVSEGGPARLGLGRIFQRFKVCCCFVFFKIL